jgi:hypothetical protein
MSRTINMNTAPTTPTESFDGFPPSFTAVNNPFKGFPTGDLEAAREARRLKVEEWKTLDLRQSFKDEIWMKAHIKEAGLRVPYYAEPATPARLKSLLFKVGILSTGVKAAIGTSIVGYLILNPDLPLWAALALIIEATGRYPLGQSQGDSQAWEPSVPHHSHR